MPATYKVLGQINPSATTLTTLYTVPAATSTVLSTISITNLAATNATFRVAVRVNGAAIANAQYLAYDSTVLANDAVYLTLGISLGAADVVSVYASSANVAFQAFGSEMT